MGFNGFKAGDRVTIITDNDGEGEVKIGQEATVLDEVPFPGFDYVIEIDGLEGVFHADEDELEPVGGYKFSDLYEQIENFKLGDKVRAVRLMVPVEKGAVGEIVKITDHSTWPYVVHFPGFDHTGSYTEHEIEPIEDDEPVTDAETAAETGEAFPALPTLGGLLEVALERTTGAADAVNAFTLLPPQGAPELQTALRTLVAAILMQPNHEEILRALVGE